MEVIGIVLYCMYQDSQSFRSWSRLESSVRYDFEENVSPLIQEAKAKPEAELKKLIG